MAELILALSVMIFFVLGYFLMRRLDNFFAKNEKELCSRAIIYICLMNVCYNYQYAREVRL